MKGWIFKCSEGLTGCRKKLKSIGWQEFMASATGLIKSADPDGEHMLVCITREWMLETLKDKEKMNQWYPAVRHEAIL